MHCAHCVGSQIRQVNTAIEIGKACELLNDTMIRTEILEFPHKDKEKRTPPEEILEKVEKG